MHPHPETPTGRLLRRAIDALPQEAPSVGPSETPTAKLLWQLDEVELRPVAVALLSMLDDQLLPAAESMIRRAAERTP
jgi:hypothetical protein